MKSASATPTPTRPAGFLHVLAGVSVFMAYKYGFALWTLTHSSGQMDNKFSALARDKHLGFLVLQNLQMLIAYLLLAVAGALLIQPLATCLTTCVARHSRRMVIFFSLALAALIHGFFTLRLVITRPYFLSENEFGFWYYRCLEVIPESIKPASLWAIFTLIPLLLLGYILIWHLRRHGRKGWIAAFLVALTVSAVSLAGHFKGRATVRAASGGKPMNVIIIGSDSLRGDLLGCAGYRPARSDGAAKDGVSPIIDGFAARSARFETCYTAIASTMESGIQLMASQYPQSHGIRQMYPNRQTVDAMKKRVIPLPALLQQRGYDTAAIGDWCAGYYEVVGLGMEHLSVSSFDNFKIYMSQAVVMAHAVIPLYFDNPLGDWMFPQLESFANFVKPEVVNRRVEKRLAEVAKNQKPFFWHVFYSCNHLPYSSPEPYRSMFVDPNYQGPNREKVAFDIDSFIGSTDLESKWKVLPPKEVNQIRALYDGCTRQFDDCVGKILASLKANGLEDNTIVIVTSDHGDDLYEPNVTLGHGLTFNGGLQANHVPMIIHLPGAAPKVIPETVRMIDVIPTLADLLDVRKPAAWQGQSFAGWIRGNETPIHRPFYGETGFPFIQFRVKDVERPKLPAMDELTFIDPSFNYQFVLKPEYLDQLIAAKQRCLQTRDWKLVCTPTAQGIRHFALFHIVSDRHCETNLAATRPDVLAPMKAALERWMDQQIESSIAEIFPSGEPK